MSEARWSRTAGVAGVVVLALWIIALVLLVLDRQLTPGNVMLSAGFLVFAGVGIVVALHQPRNPVGWLLIFFTFLFALGIDAQEFAVYSFLLGHRLPFATTAVLVKPVATAAFLLLPLAVFLFPDGRLASPRWRWVLGAYAVLSGVVMADAFAPAIAAVAGHDIRLNRTADVDTRHLRGWLVHTPVWLTVALWLLMGAIWLSFVAHQFVSWRWSVKPMLMLLCCDPEE